MKVLGKEYRYERVLITCEAAPSTRYAFQGKLSPL